MKEVKLKPTIVALTPAELKTVVFALRHYQKTILPNVTIGVTQIDDCFTEFDPLNSEQVDTLCAAALEPAPELIEAVKTHARQHDNYENKGWDIVIETLSDEEIAAVLVPNMTPEAAIRQVAQAFALAVRLSHRRDIEGTAF